MISSFGQSQNPELLGYVKCCRPGYLPGNFLLSRIDPRDPKKPRPQLDARRWWSAAQCDERNLHFAVPDLAGRVDSSLHLYSGVPSRSAAATLTGAVDLEVYPFALRRYLELLIPAYRCEIGAEKCLCDIPVPKHGRFGCG